ncbi:MAG: thioesterase [Burkholderiaceae bacterium]|nr:MAG: thioesterase [Burkholderiaceae bacterium]
MNLYLRLLVMLLTLPFVRRRDFLESASVRFLALPNDCDINFHVNNGRYLTFMDLARVHFCAQSGLLKLILTRGWMPVLAAADINFIRPLPPLRRFTIRTRLLGWDDKYFYIEQRFERKGQLCALAFVKGLMLSKGRPLPSNQILQGLGVDSTSPDLPPALRHWLDMTELKKQHVQPEV